MRYPSLSQQSFDDILPLASSLLCLLYVGLRDDRREEVKISWVHGLLRFFWTPNLQALGSLQMQRVQAGCQVFKDTRDWTFAPHQSYGVLGWFQHVIKFVGLMIAILSWAEFLSFSPTCVLFFDEASAMSNFVPAQLKPEENFTKSESSSL